MAKVIGQTDSLKRLMAALKRDGMKEFKSLKAIVHFNDSYEATLAEMKEVIRHEVLDEIEKVAQKVSDLKSKLNTKLLAREKLLSNEIIAIREQIEKYSHAPGSFLEGVYLSFRKWLLQRRSRMLRDHFQREKERPFRCRIRKIKRAERKLTRFKAKSDRRIEVRLKTRSKAIHFKKSILDRHADLYHGAIGEESAVEELIKLPDSFIIINGFRLQLKTPYYKKDTAERILSIQADHIVVGPTGIFLIETKNWSQASFQRNDFYPPAEQVKRAGYTLYRYLNDSMNKGLWTYLTGKWSKKVSIRNILLVTNSKPMQQYPFVKVLGLREVNGYITYFQPIYGIKQVKKIVNHLVRSS